MRILSTNWLASALAALRSRIKASSRVVGDRVLIFVNRLRNAEVSEREMEDERALRQRDPEENEAGRLPPNEAVRLPCVWVLECYPPSEIESLIHNLDQLGWSRGRLHEEDDELVNFLYELRSRFDTGGSYNIGGLVPTGTRSWGMYFPADLPSGVQRADVEFLQIVPSTTMLCIRFMFEEGAAAAVEEPFHSDYVSYREPLRNGYRIHSPRSIRAMNVRAARGYLSAACVEWVREKLPGIFAREDAQHPVVELLLTARADLRHLSPEEAAPDYLNNLGLRDLWSTWAAKEPLGLHLIWPEDAVTMCHRCISRQYGCYSKRN